MAFAKARTALAQLEEKLRRQLGLAGEIGATFLPEVTPVIIAADLREAGNAANTGRAFQGALELAGAGGIWSFSPSADIYVDYITLTHQGGAAAIARLWLTVPGQAPAIAIGAGLWGTWVDRKLIAGDQVPLAGTPAMGALTGTNVNDQNRIWAGFLSVGQTVTLPMNMMLPAGSALNYSGGTAVGFTIRGRIWP